jgi:hypothetical protein
MDKWQPLHRVVAFFSNMPVVSAILLCRQFVDECHAHDSRLSALIRFVQVRLRLLGREKRIMFDSSRFVRSHAFRSLSQLGSFSFVVCHQVPANFS